MNTFVQGISLPVPPVIEGLESKFPSRVLKHPEMLDFARVCIDLKMIVQKCYF